MEKSKLNSLIKRVVSTLVLVPVVVGCILGGYPSIYLLALIGAALLSWEWADMVPSRRPSFYAVTYLTMATTAVLIESLTADILIMAAALILAFVKSRGEQHRGLLLLGIPYIAIGIGAVVAVYASYGPLIVLWFMFVIWGVDIGGYLFGSTLKGPKLAPKISPHKTWAGLFGGMLLAVAASYGICRYCGIENPDILNAYMLVAAVLTVIAQIGDLIESAIKRRLGLKDSSNIIPGHGGIFDRIDGLIFAAPFAYLMLRNLDILID